MIHITAARQSDPHLIFHGMEEVVGSISTKVHHLQNLTADDADLTDDR